MNNQLLNEKGYRGKPRAMKVILTVLILLFLISSIVMGVLVTLIMNPMVNKHMPVTFVDPSPYGLAPEEVALLTEDGLLLSSWHVAAEEEKGTVILLSGIHRPSVTAFWGYARMLRDAGYSSLLIEMRGHGTSEGEQVALGYQEWKDVESGVKWIRNETSRETLPVIVWGTSMGGAVALNSSRVPGVDGVIAASAFASWNTVFHDNMTTSGLPKLLADVMQPFLHLYLGFMYGFENLSITPMNAMKQMEDLPVLLMHTSGDTQVPYGAFQRLSAVAPASVETFTREGDHHFVVLNEFLENPEEDIPFREAVLGFLSRHFNE